MAYSDKKILDFCQLENNCQFYKDQHDVDFSDTILHKDWAAFK